MATLCNNFSAVTCHATNEDRFGGIILFINKKMEIIENITLVPGRVVLVTTKNKETSESICFISIYGKASENTSEKQTIFNTILDNILEKQFANTLFWDILTLSALL